MAYLLKPGQAAGFDISGFRLPDGRIELQGFYSEHNEIVDSFPDKVELLGVTYTLEDTKEQDNGYCWGVYV